MELFKILGKVAIDGVEKAAKDLGETTEEAKKSAKETDALGISYEKLTSKVANQQKKVELLKQKYADLCLTQGKNSKEAEECAEEISKLSTELKENRATLEEAQKAADQFDNSLEDVGSTANKSGKEVGGLTSLVGKGIATAIKWGTALTGTVTALIALTESTRDYRTEQGKLNAGFKTAGHTTEAAKKTYQALQSVLGESDQSVEAANHLAKLVDTEKDLQLWTDICTGVFATFGDSLPVEGLTEAANETAKVGQVVGPLADALNWAGVAEDDFNKKLALCNSEQERAQLITSTLTGLYKSAADAYKVNNRAVIEANAAQEKWNSSMAKVGAIVEPVATFLKSTLAGAIGFTADRLKEMIDFCNGNRDTMVGMYKSSEEAAAEIEKLEEKIEELLATDPAYWNDMLQNELDNTRLQLANVTGEYNRLVDAENAAADAAQDTAATAQGAVGDLAVSAQEMADRLQETYTRLSESVAGWFGPFDAATTTATANINEMMSAMQSQAEFNTTYNENLQQLSEYGLGGLAAQFQSLGAEGAAYAAEITRAVEEAGGAASEGGQAIIQGLADANSQVINTQEELAQTMALQAEKVDGALSDIVSSVSDSVEEMDKSAEAKAAGENTIKSYLTGLERQIPAVLQRMAALGHQITQTLQNNIGTVTVPVVKVNMSGAGGYATGLDYVPYDNFPAYLHKGEAVLTAEEATAWRAGKNSSNGGSSPRTEDSGNGGGVTIIQHIQAIAQTPVELASATAAYFEQARWAMA